MHNDPLGFDEYAEQWDENQQRWELSQRAAEQIVNHLWGEVARSVEKPHTVELGAGTGMLSRCLAPYLGQTLLLDSSPQMLTVAQEQIGRENLENLRVQSIDLTAGEIPGAPYELVLAQLFLHHLPELPAYLAQVRAQMTAGGWLAAVEFDFDEEYPHTHGDHEIIEFDRETFAQWLADAGFKNVHAGDAGLIHLHDEAAPPHHIFLALAQA